MEKGSPTLDSIALLLNRRTTRHCVRVSALMNEIHHGAGGDEFPLESGSAAGSGEREGSEAVL